MKKTVELNKEQKEAIEYLDGPLLIVAGPGTGKTQLLSARAANIIKKGKTKPENILIVTFSNAAARAMRERLSAILGPDGYNVEVETFHSFANSIVLESEGAINYVKDKIDMTEVEKIRALEYILDNVRGVEELRPFGAPYVHLREIRARISELKNEGITPGEFKNYLKGISRDGIDMEEKHIKRLNALSLIYEKYERLKDEECSVLFDERGRKDYDDMILIALNALKKEKGLRNAFRDQYRYIMVDEYQDTNGAQLEMLLHILDPDSQNLCCVGDDDQAIYRFQGATLANFRVLKEKLPSLKTIALKNNYRSNEEIVNFTSRIISALPKDERVLEKKLKACKDYKDKKIEFMEFLTEEEELVFIINEIRNMAKKIAQDDSLSREERQKPYNNIAVLVRRRDQRQKIIEAFLKAGIPYAADGSEDIRREKRVRQMLDILELANVSVENNEKKSLALYKVLSADYVGAFHEDILKFIAFVSARKGMARRKNPQTYKAFNLFEEFQGWFPAKSDNDKPPARESSHNLKISKTLGLKNPHALHRAAWAVRRLLVDAKTNPVHDLLMGYIADMDIYGFMLEKYEKNKILRIKDLRALVAFINKIKESSLAEPSLRLEEFMNELELREIHGMPIEGELATLNQDGVRIYTAHSAKGLEFHAVFMPFSLELQSWPVRSKPEAITLPPDIYKSKERIKEKSKRKLLKLYDELRLFYVASTRAKSTLIYTATPREKVIISRFLGQLELQPKSGSPADEDKFLIEFLKGSTDRDPFKDATSILRDMARSTNLTPTKLNNYLICRRKFMLNSLLGLPGKKTSHLVFGNCNHKALEETYRYFMRMKKFPLFELYKKFFKQELEFQGVNNTIKKMCIDRLETLNDWYKRESKNPVMPFSLETDLSVPFPDGFVFKGKFDKLEIEKGGSAKVIDYKTGFPDKHVKAVYTCRDVSSHECDDYYRQLIAYKLIFDRNQRGSKRHIVRRGMIQFLEPAASTVKKYGLEKGSYVNIDIELTEEMVGELKKVITKCWKEIQQLKFDKLPERDGKDRCRKCDFDSICWGQ
ncbi:MAG: ATP-dependent helicase [Candidatus Omnitrophota bacterium]|nr:MAG: ATP-dependent helicase [Candidatus Omnitrophota bacterium]